MWKRGALWAFLLIEAALYAAFLLGDLRGGDTTALKYLSIWLCVLFSGRVQKDHLVATALLLTAIADLFLLVLDRDYLLGVAFFCVVQGLYLYRICRQLGRGPNWPARTVLLLAALGLLAAMGRLNLLNGVAALYFTNFVGNVWASFGLKGRKMSLFRWGLVLFLCCDICVGAFQQGDMLPAALRAAAGFGMWTFYLPGQVLISLSTGEVGGNHEGK